MKNPIALVSLTLTAMLAPAGAQLAGQLGVLDPQNANGGINPQTGVAWAEGDTYRLAFYTEDKRNALSNEIDDYNAFVQSVAAGSSKFPDLGLGTWKVLGSTATVSARQNTGTDADDNAPIFVLDGVTMIAEDSADMWDGFPVRFAAADSPNGQTMIFSPYLNEDGEELVEFVFGTEIATGSSSSGGIAADPLGDPNEDGARLTVGASQANNTGRVWIRFGNRNPASDYSFYALSEPLTVVIGGAKVPFALSIAPATLPSVGYNLGWPSKDGKLYRLRSSPSLETAPQTWNIVEEDILPTVPENVYNIELVDSKLFYILEEYSAPPIDPVGP